MATQVQFRGGTTNEHSSFNGVMREVTVDTDKKTVVVQDGTTNGGFPLLRQDLDNLPAGTVATADIAGDAITGALIANDAVGAEHIEVLDAALQFGDNVKVQLGAGNDLEIWHQTNSDHGYIKNSTGDLYIQGNNSGSVVNSIVAKGTGAVELFYDSTKKFETTSTGVKTLGNLSFRGSADNEKIEFSASSSHLKFFDGVKAKFGTGVDLQIYHDGTDSFIHNQGANAGNFYIRGAGANVDKWLIIQAKSGEDSIVCKRNAEVFLAYDGSKKLETTSVGIAVTGKISPTGNIQMPDSTGIKLGASDDFVLYHYSTDNTNRIESGTECPMIFQYWDGSAYEVMAKLTPNGASELYHNGLKSCQTDSNGLVIYGPEGGDANVYIYADEGDDNDDKWKLKASSSASEFDIGNYATGSWITNIRCYGNNAVDLYYDGSVKLATTTYGFKTPHYIQVGTSGTATANWHIGQENDGSFRFYNGTYGSGTEVFRAKYDGDLSIADGNLVVASGHGIDFSATSDATGKTSELLDDYEEGTFTPAYITPGNANTTFSISHQKGYYTKVGNIVTVNIYIQGYAASNSGSTGNDYLRVGGLPFAAAAVPSGNVRHSPSFAIGTLYKIEADNVYAYTHGGETSIRLFVHTNGGTGTALNSSQANQNTTEIFLSGTYMV